MAARVVLAALVLSLAGCSERTVTSDPAVAPSPTPAPSPVPSPAPVPAPPTPTPAPLPLTVVSVTFDRALLFAGEGATGTVQLTRPAAAPGVVVLLRSSDPGAAVPAQMFTIAQDSDRASFSVTTARSLAEDRTISITASLNDSSASAILQVRITPRVQTFLTFISDPGEFIGGGSFVRVTSPETRFLVTGTATRVTMYMGGWYARFEAPRGSQLRTRRYDNVIWVADDTHAGMEISGQGRGCDVGGIWFDIHDFAVESTGEVLRLDASFEQRCRNSTATLRGEIKFVR